MEHVCFKFRFRVEFFLFSSLGIVSLLCDLIRHLVPVQDSKARYFAIVFQGKFMRAPKRIKTLFTGQLSAESLDWESFHLQFFPPKHLCMSTVVGSQHGATTEAAESKIGFFQTFYGLRCDL
jgi:hypothetical protein